MPGAGREQREGRSGSQISGMISPMTPVVIIKSDDLSAWIGIAGVVVGVVLAAWIDWWRSHRTRRLELRHELLRAGSDLAFATGAYHSTARAAGTARDEPAWHELLQARLNEMGTASLTINLSGNETIQQASLQIVEAASTLPAEPAPADPAVFLRQTFTQLSANAAALAAYREAVRKAKL